MVRVSLLCLHNRYTDAVSGAAARSVSAKGSGALTQINHAFP
jgi:hypothetical protein